MPMTDSSPGDPNSASDQGLELSHTGWADGGPGCVVVWMFFWPLLIGGFVFFYLPGFRGEVTAQRLLITGGVMLLLLAFHYRQAIRVATYFRFGRARVEIAPGLVRPGVPFNFRYRQGTYLPTQVDLAVSLIAREVIVIPGEDGDRTEHRDHLIQSHQTHALRGRPGTPLEVEHELRVPATGAAEFNTGDHEVK